MNHLMCLRQFLLEFLVCVGYLNVSGIESTVASTSRQDALYNDAAVQFGRALNRLATAYEFDLRSAAIC